MNAIMLARPRKGASMRVTVSSSPDGVRTRSPSLTSVAVTVTHVVVMVPYCPIRMDEAEVSEERDPVSDGTDAWHQKLHHTPKGRLSSATAQTPGMERLEAISGRLTGSDKIWMGENHVAGGLR